MDHNINPRELNTLSIDTSDNTKITVTVTTNKVDFKVESQPQDSRADVVLRLIEKACLEANLAVNEIERIYCKKGPGSYTGLRVGFAIANALSLALLVPLNDNKIGMIDTPVYS